MRKLLFILLLPVFANSQPLTRIVNGVVVQLSPDDSADIVSQWNQNRVNDSINRPVDTTLRRLAVRQLKARMALAVMERDLSAISYIDFVKSTDQLFTWYERDLEDIFLWIRGDAPYALTGFPSKAYYTIARRLRMISILQ